MAYVLTAVKRLVREDAGQDLREDDGQDLIEYALLASLIALAAVLILRTLGQTINTVLWQLIVQGLQSV